MSSAADLLRNRLKKNLRRLPRLLPRETDCFLAYDQDVPEVPVVVEKWGPRARLVEVPGRHVRTDKEHEAYLEALAETVAEGLKVARDDVVVRRRVRRRAGEQHEKQADKGERHEVRERGLRFGVNLVDYLDTGLFLDHRNAREEVRQLAAGRRVLNLFAYTGAFTVYAAAGEADQTVTVDLSQRYLAWAEDNLAANGLADERRHRFEAADALAWLDEARGERFDLIVLDPPTASTSKKMAGDLDVQRDHPFLLDRALNLLGPRGVLFFSTNLRSFELAPGAFGGAACEEITGRSVPPDFRGRPHRCWKAKV